MLLHMHKYCFCFWWKLMTTSSTMHNLLLKVNTAKTALKMFHSNIYRKMLGSIKIHIGYKYIYFVLSNVLCLCKHLMSRHQGARYSQLQQLSATICQLTCNTYTCNTNTESIYFSFPTKKCKLMYLPLPVNTEHNLFTYSMTVILYVWTSLTPQACLSTLTQSIDFKKTYVHLHCGQYNHRTDKYCMMFVRCYTQIKLL